MPFFIYICRYVKKGLHNTGFLIASDVSVCRRRKAESGAGTEWRRCQGYGPYRCHTCIGGYDTEPYGKVYLHEEFHSLRDDYIYWLEILRKCAVAYGNQGIVGSYRILDNSLTSRKIKMIKPQYRVYRKVEKLGVIRSLFYLTSWALHGIVKYWK